MIALKERIAGAFERASSYDEHAAVQQEVAQRLARRIAALPLDAAPRILEIGCGTGFLAAATEGLVHGADWLMTDISPAMVARSRRRFGASATYRFATLDGEAPVFDRAEAPFDLVCANFAVHWFENLQQGLLRLFRLLRPGGHLIFSTLADGTFAEWRSAHAALGSAAGTPSYPTRETLAGMRLDGVEGRFNHERLVETYPSASDFLHALRAIGAGTPRPDHRPLSAAAMRAVMRRFEEEGASASYCVTIADFERPNSGAPA
ncbi:MAG: biotin biosynthesis protein [Alphaproteobacteria bacterium]|nr:biotin biosynthesis protein [Alphaproteobacteria bacterium]